MLSISHGVGIWRSSVRYSLSLMPTTSSAFPVVWRFCLMLRRKQKQKQNQPTPTPLSPSLLAPPPPARNPKIPNPELPTTDNPQTAIRNPQTSNRKLPTSNHNNNNTIWRGSVLTGEEPPPHSGELNHSHSQVGGPTQSQLSRPVSSGHHISMERRLLRKHF